MYDVLYSEIDDLRFWNKILSDQLSAFESGEKYLRIIEECRKAREADARTIKRLEAELEKERRERKKSFELWYSASLELAEKHDKLMIKHKELHEKYIKKCRENYALKTRLEKERERANYLKNKGKKDYRNSSLPSSMSPNHETIHNSREKSGKKPGGQPGHKHHGRKEHKASRVIVLPPPDEYQDTSRYVATGRVIKKQKVSVRVVTDVVEYVTPEYRDKKTGQRVHAEFPEGLKEDVTYDSSVKALAYMINNDLYTSIDKTKVFLEEVTHGELSLSAGFICGLSKEFSEKTEEEREKIFRAMMDSEIMHSDFTFSRVSGKQASVIITATKDAVLYQERAKKGDEGVKGSPLENYEGILVSDHESALTKHGSKHQECLAHILRYAKDGIENEPDKTWHTLLCEWIGKSTAYWNDIDKGKEVYKKKEAGRLIGELKGILDKAKEEYEYEPPSRYFRTGYNTYKRMTEEFEDYILFLKNPKVPPTNNLAERCARKIKRKGHQVIAFRTEAGFGFFCDGKTIIETTRSRCENIYDAIVRCFA